MLFKIKNFEKMWVNMRKKFFTLAFLILCLVRVAEAEIAAFNHYNDPLLKIPLFLKQEPIMGKTHGK
jgi:hypothetical protein